jgi:hypothetical protein
MADHREVAQQRMAPLHQVMDRHPRQ